MVFFGFFLQNNSEGPGHLNVIMFHYNRLKKEMVAKVNQVAAEFRKVSNKHMAETTKRTIRENVSINAQLSKMSDKTLELIQVCVFSTV